MLADRANRMYLAMELVRGPTLLDFISMNGALPVDQACMLIRDIARALRDLHASEVVHRDLTSSNIIVVETSIHAHCAKVIDFGLATDIGAEGARSQRLTRVGELPGTAHYMAPEQVWGQAAHPTFDVYALGIVTYEMLTGEPPWHAMSDIEVKARKCDLSLPPPSIASVRRDVPEPLTALIASCLMPRYEDRLQSAGAFVVQLDAVRAQLGFVDPRAGETTGVVGMPRTIDQPEREPKLKLKQIVADAMAAKEARSRAGVQDAVTAPVSAAQAAGITGKTQPATAAMLAASPREPTRPATVAEAGQAAPPISGRTLPADAAAVRPGAVMHAQPAGGSHRPLAVLGIVVGLLAAVPILFWWLGRTPDDPQPALMAAAGSGQIESSATARSEATHDSATQAAAPIPPKPDPIPAVAAEGSTSSPAHADADADADPDADPDADDSGDTGSEPAPRDTGSRPHPRDSGGHTPTPLPKPPPTDSLPPDQPAVQTPWTESRCANERKLAMADRLAGRFAGVLTHTRVKRCWPSGRERLELRVRAFSELGKYRACVQAGTSSKDAGVQRMVRRCRKRLGGTP